MQTKCVCPECGDVVKTYSINNFRHCGTQFDVESNLLAGEQAKYQKMVEKYGKEVSKAPVVKEAKPVEKIVEKVEEKKNDTPIVEPIIEEKVVEPKVEPSRKRKKKKKPEIVEKVEMVKSGTEPSDFSDYTGENFGFF